jgi:hypothetical protein
MPTKSLDASATSSPNIKGHIDVYNIYKSIGDKGKLAKIYINVYSLKTSNKVPQGFFHRDEIDVLRDVSLIIKGAKNLK